VVVNVVLLGVFGVSLWKPPSMIERFARLQTPDLPFQAIAYTRKVTWIWCGFFILNGSIATASVFANDKVWALYNGLLSYIFMGILLAGEYLVRLRVQNRHTQIALAKNEIDGTELKNHNVKIDQPITASNLKDHKITQ